MKNLLKNNLVSYLLYSLTVILIIQTIWFSFKIIVLPSTGIDYLEQNSNKSLYYKIKLISKKDIAVINTKKQVISSGTINDLQLLAIYKSKDITVITVMYKGKSKVLSDGEEINGFTLINATNNSAEFKKNDKDYSLQLIKSSNLGNNDLYKNDSIIKDKNKQTSTHKKIKIKKDLGNISDFGDYKVIDKKVFEHYTENLQDIQKDIGIKSLGKDNGFAITFVRRNSLLSKLGVERNDIIKSFNGQEIHSNKDVFEIYRGIKNVKDISLIVERNKENVELNYEIQ